jgi:hypothetical protein
MVEGEGDAFRFKSQCAVLLVSRMKATHQTKNQRTISSSKPAPLN